jgi:hypothetical protein
MVTKLVGLIDADFIKYLVAYDIEKMFKHGLKEDAVIPYNTIAALTDKRISKIRDDTISNTKEYIFLFSGKTKDNYRSLIASVKKYKGQRTYVEKYPGEGEYQCMVERYIEENYNYHKEADLEADDLCVMAHSPLTYIYSNDKDLSMSPGIHFDVKAKKFTRTTVDGGFRTLMAQTLSGDSVDNIAGMDGIGKIGGPKLVEAESTCEEAMTMVINTFTAKHGLKDGLDRFVEMYTLVNLKTARGAWTQLKYKEFFDKIEMLTKEEDRFEL